MSEWTNRDDRQADAKAQYEHIMTTPAPPAIGAYIDSGVIGFVFGEMWRRGVLTPRDRRWLTLACVGAADAPIPMETHTYAALNSGDVTNEEIDEFLLFFGTQMGWPKGSAMNTHILAAMAKIAEERGEEMQLPAFVPWTDPIDDDVRRARGEAAYAEVHGVPAGARADRVPGPRVPRLPLRRGVDARRVPHPARPPTGEHLLQRRARRRHRDHRAPRGRAAQRRAQLRGAPGGRDARRGVPGVDRRPPPRRPARRRRRRARASSRPDAEAVLAGGAVHRRAGGAREVAGGVDQRHVGERLREVAEQAPGRRVVLLGEQADVVGQRRAAARTAPGPRRCAPSSARLSASQNEQGRNTPSPGGQPVDAPPRSR